MTKLITAGVGGFPRIGEGAEGQKLRRAIASCDRQKISREELLLVEDEVTAEAVLLQEQTGLDLLTDGQIRWYDQVSHCMGRLSGVEIGSLSRFFDTNTYYRRPVVRGKIARQAPVFIDDFLFAQRVTPKPVKPVLTGPCTLARLSVNHAYDNLNELMEALASVLAEEVGELSCAGAMVIQIDEPGVLQFQEDLAILPDLLKEIARNKGNAELALYTYFGDASPVYERLQQCPVDILGLDFTYSHGLPETIASSGVTQTLGLGLIDGRNTKMETEAELFPVFESLLRLPGMETAYLNPSCGLEYLPREKALAKLSTMVALRDKFLGGHDDWK